MNSYIQIIYLMDHKNNTKYFNYLNQTYKIKQIGRACKGRSIGGSIEFRKAIKLIIKYYVD